MVTTNQLDIDFLDTGVYSGTKIVSLILGYIQDYWIGVIEIDCATVFFPRWLTGTGHWLNGVFS